MQKLLGGREIKTRVAAGSVMVLGLGAWLTPPAVPTTLSAPQEHAAPLLEEQVQLREVVRPFRGVQEVAERVRRFGVAIPSRERVHVPVLSDFLAAYSNRDEIGFGAVVADTHVLAHAAYAGTVTGIVLAAVVVFETVGPLLTRRALVVTGEAKTIPEPLQEVAVSDASL